MKKFSILYLLSILWGGVISPAYAQDKFLPKYLREGNQTFLKFTRYTSPNGWITFRQDTVAIRPETFFQQFNSALGLSPLHEFRVVKDETDDKKFRHRRYQLYFKNIKVEGVEYMLHDLNNRLESANGRIVEDLVIDIANPIQEQVALLAALADQKLTLASFKDLSLIPKGELIIAATNQDFVKENFRLCYAFNIVLPGSPESYRIFVDATLGTIFRRLPLFANCSGERKNLDFLRVTPDLPGTGHTIITGAKAPLVTATFLPNYSRYLNGQSSLTFETQQVGSANQLSILNTQLNTRSDVRNTYTWADNPEVQNSSLAWGNNASNATTAHWLTQRMYQYYRDRYSYNGYDGNGTYPRVLVDLRVDNFAQWDNTQNAIRFGTINGRSLVTMDVVGHEYTHAVTQYTAGLAYAGESGAINESISDIFGTVLERATLPNWNWTLGEDAQTVRSMSYPPQYGQPENYANLSPINPPCTGGSGGNDFCGVHTNSGIMNKWFYALAAAIPFDDAAYLVHYTQRYFLTSNSNYRDVRDATWQVAANLYGTCSTVQARVAQSWRLVGLSIDDCPATCQFSLSPITASNATCNQTLTLSVNCLGGAQACDQNITYYWSGPANAQFSSNGSTVTTTAPATGGTYTYNVTGVKGQCQSNANPISVNVSCSGGNGCAQRAISVVAPTPNQTLTASSFPFYFDIRTQVCDPQGVNQVQYNINGNWAGYVEVPDNNSSQPYTLTAARWAALTSSNGAFKINQPGTYTIQPRLFSNGGGYLDASPIQITVVQGGGGNPPQPGGLAFGTPVMNCSSGQLTITTTGGNGSPVEFRAAGLQDWNTNNVFNVPTYQRNGTTFTIQARQSGSEINPPLTYTTSCPGYRFAAIDAEETEASGLLIAPNPTHGQFTVRFQLVGKQVATLSVVNLQGQSVWQREVVGTGQPQMETVELSRETAGQYVVRLKAANGLKVGKLLLLR